jgi:hypothetical protein
MLFIAVSGCSLLWSETASPIASIAYWSGTAIDVATIVFLLRAGSVPEVATSVMKGFIWASCCVALIAWLMPTQYDFRLGDEDIFNPNSICNVCVFAVFFAQYLMRRKMARFGIVTFFLVLTILRTLSKTTIAAFLISQIYLVIQDRSMSRRRKLFLTIGSILVVLMFWGLFEAYYNFYTTNGNQAETLTGRTPFGTMSSMGRWNVLGLDMGSTPCGTLCLPSALLKQDMRKMSSSSRLTPMVRSALSSSAESMAVSTPIFGAWRRNLPE